MGEIRMTRDFFLWCMSVIYLFAFASLFVQIPGLYGDNGILPAKLVLKTGSAESAIDIRDLVTNQPTVLRLLPRLGLDTQTSMDLVCLGGVILAFVAMVSRHQRNTIVFAVLWALYFSMFQVGQTFLWFQWDILLLEAGFLCLMVAPLNLFGMRSVWYHQHDHVTFWLVKWLLFRLMFASGVVKLTSNCPTWWGLTALNYHYETQCIPAPLAWYFHQLPEWFNKLSVAATYVIEIAVPLMFFSPVRSQRIFAFYAQCFLMFLIMLTGNYNFFNLLTVAISFSLVDDNFIRRWIGQSPKGEDEEAKHYPLIGQFWRPIKWALNIMVYGALVYWTIKLFDLKVRTKPLRVESDITFTRDDYDSFLKGALPVTIWLGVLSLGWEVLKALVRSVALERGIFKKLMNMVGCVIFGAAAFWIFGVSLVDYTVIETNARDGLWPVLHQWHAKANPYEITSSYGLFRRMTGVEGRPEVILEGSNHIEKGWKEYHFLYKPGNVSQPLGYVAPHQPRLDWQMWFAALGNYQHNPWFLNLVYRLLHNQPEVLELMGENPFPDKPPKYIRAYLYHYSFTKLDSKHRWTDSDADWWVREVKEEYLPILSKDEPSFVNYLKKTGIYQDPKEDEKKKNKKNKKDKKHKETDAKPSALQTVMVFLRRYLGQWDGFKTCMALFVTGLVLTFLDPTVQLLKEPLFR